MALGRAARCPFARSNQRIKGAARSAGALMAVAQPPRPLRLSLPTGSCEEARAGPLHCTEDLVCPRRGRRLVRAGAQTSPWPAVQYPLLFFVSAAPGRPRAHTRRAAPASCSCAAACAHPSVDMTNPALSGGRATCGCCPLAIQHSHHVTSPAHMAG
ncbi:MAG: hypothetical protein J3K34DRAFT_433374 [Monoraphidium minutum]|nr:MAG: hypothetical protein J3K34DRAFT_433374 [Monoraphidium minutum]